MINVLTQASIFALLSLVVVLVPMVMGAAYAIRPSEARLALMRPLSLAGIFAGLSGFCLGTINALVGALGSGDGFNVRSGLLGFSEALVPLFVGFGSLTVGWLCVAVGLRRSQ